MCSPWDDTKMCKSKPTRKQCRDICTKNSLFFEIICNEWLEKAAKRKSDLTRHVENDCFHQQKSWCMNPKCSVARHAGGIAVPLSFLIWLGLGATYSFHSVSENTVCIWNNNPFTVDATFTYTLTRTKATNLRSKDHMRSPNTNKRF